MSADAKITPVLTKAEQIALADFLGRMDGPYRAALRANSQFERTQIRALSRLVRSVHRKALFAIAGDTRARRT